jgi:putative restriction endonuclease
MLTMNIYVAVTDSDWYDLLASQSNIEEVNFWQPGGNRAFSAIDQGGLFLLKPHRRNVIFGGGIFAYSTLLPVSLAWAAFQIGNGAVSLEHMRQRIEKYRRKPASPHEDYTIGCIILTQPFFFTEVDWVELPDDWKSNIVQGRRYDVSQEPGLSLYEAVTSQINLTNKQAQPSLKVAEPLARYGTPTLVQPRLGQGAFRVVVTDAYQRRCALSGEKVLPVLEAAHIRPYGEGGRHQIENGLLLRSDLHTLFDRGYLTVTPDYHLEVSSRIRDDYENGHDYYVYHGILIREPRRGAPRPSVENLTWHNENRYLG